VKRKSLKELVRNCYFENRRRYGARRIAKSLSRKGIRIGRRKVGSLMKEEKLQAIQSRRFKPQTTDARGTIASLNLLAGIELEEGGSGKIIIGDITYIRLRGGKFCYMAMWQDKVTRRIIGWSLGMEMTAELVISALQKAIRKGLLKAGAIVHTDRGSQYGLRRFRQLLESQGYRQSMSGKGNCYDNAQAESFFSRFKAELVEGGVFEDIEQARSEIFSYIEGYYNRVRLHSGLGYKSPMEFEAELQTKNGGSKRQFFV
jgi:putative transposase